MMENLKMLLLTIKCVHSRNLILNKTRQKKIIIPCDSLNKLIYLHKPQKEGWMEIIYGEEWLELGEVRF